MSPVRALLLLCIISSALPLGLAATPAMFIFGDSLVDAGNNNNLPGTGKANFYPYGKDFPNGVATGRFSNGKLVVDELADLMGLPLPVAFANAAGDNIKFGVNFGSAGSGVFADTGAAQIGRIPMAQQVANFRRVQERLYETLGAREAYDFIASSIFYINDGVNDIADALTHTNTVTESENERLASTLSMYINELYSMGARKIVVTDVLPIGCEPFVAAARGRCDPRLNNLAKAYNQLLVNQLDQLRHRFPDARIIYASLYNAMIGIIENPSFYGLANVHQPCYPGRMPFCADASHYAFWDFFHPTEALNRIVAARFWRGSREYAYPINVEALAHM